MPKRHNTPYFHPSTTTANPPGSGTPAGGNGSPPGSGTGSNTSGGSTSSAMAQYNAQQRRLQRKASNRYIDSAHTLGLQAGALRLALNKTFKHRLNVQLANLDLHERETDRELMHGYRTRLGSLKDSESDNEKAAGAQTYANLANRGRERANALNEATANGAGESDMLRAQSMSLNNWNANQNEVNRSFFDSRTSINSSLHDLNADTRTGRLNNAMQASSDREQVWNSYYDRRSETLTALGNTLGQQAEDYGFANEQVGSKKSKKHQKSAAAGSGQAFRQASRASGQAYHDPGIPKTLTQWEGASDFDGSMNNSKFSSASTELAEKKPEGAGLRSWTA